MSPRLASPWRPSVKKIGNKVRRGSVGDILGGLGGLTWRGGQGGRPVEEEIEVKKENREPGEDRDRDRGLGEGGANSRKRKDRTNIRTFENKNQIIRRVDHSEPFSRNLITAGARSLDVHAR